MIKTLFLPTLTTAINTYLKLDDASQDRLRRLTGKAVTLELLPIHLIFHCQFTQDGVKVTSKEELESQAKITGTPLQMLGVMLTKDDRHRFFAEDMTITGDAEFAQQVIQLFDELEIDWEEQASHLVGDIPAHHAGRLIRKTREWLKHLDQSLTQDISEYLQEEAALLPSKLALNDLFEDIDTIRMDVDRLSLRVRQLHDALNADEETQ